MVLCLSIGTLGQISALGVAGDPCINNNGCDGFAQLFCINNVCQTIPQCTMNVNCPQFPYFDNKCLEGTCLGSPSLCSVVNCVAAHPGTQCIDPLVGCVTVSITPPPTPEVIPITPPPTPEATPPPTPLVTPMPTTVEPVPSTPQSDDKGITIFIFLFIGGVVLTFVIFGIVTLLVGVGAKARKNTK